MTPFDPVALLAMLLSFYPLVSVGALQRARVERPDYFAGGVLFGSTGEKLRLPDGRAFDLIFDAGGASARWQVLDVTSGGGGGADDPFPLEPGALTPIDETIFPPPAPVDTFGPLIGEALDELGGEDGQLWRASQGVGASTPPAELLAAFAPIDDGESARVEQFAGLDAAVPDDVLEHSIGHGDRISAEARTFEERPPPEIDLDELPPPPDGPDVPNEPDRP